MNRTVRYAILVTALFACGDSGVEPWAGPHEMDSLRMTASIGQPALSIGDTTSIAFRVHNDGVDTANLVFPDCRRLAVYVATAGGDPVYSTASGWSCIALGTTLVMTIPPGAVTTVALPVGGGSYRVASGALSVLHLAPGEYLAFARLVHPELRMVTPVVSFVVKE